jgi:hypothetical protein
MFTIDQTREMFADRGINSTAPEVAGYENVSEMLDSLVGTFSAVFVAGNYTRTIRNQAHTMISVELANAGLVTKHTSKERTDYATRILQCVIVRAVARLDFADKLAGVALALAVG